MDTQKLRAILRLQQTRSIGTILAKKLINTVGDVEFLFKERSQSLQRINGVGAKIAKHLQDESQLHLIDKELQYVLDNKVDYLYFQDEDYPVYLKECADGPLLFFKEGNIDFKNDKILSIVGTRNMTSYGRDFCNQLINDLAEYDPIIVSGLAYGVDICAHKAAIENRLQTIAVLAHGLEKIYPRSHKKYIRQIYERGGVITEFWHQENPMREHFLQRNRIVAGLSKATIVIESAEKGGSLVTADIANSYDREVFAVPGKTTDKYSKGCNELIKKYKAQLMTSSEDLVKMLNWDTKTTPSKKIQKQLFIELDHLEQKVYDYLQYKDGEFLDVIALECKISTFRLASILLQLELKGVVKPLPGKMFTLA